MSQDKKGGGEGEGRTKGKERGREKWIFGSEGSRGEGTWEEDP